MTAEEGIEHLSMSEDGSPQVFATTPHSEVGKRAKMVGLWSSADMAKKAKTLAASPSPACKKRELRSAVSCPEDFSPNVNKKNCRAAAGGWWCRR